MKRILIQSSAVMLIILALCVSLTGEVRALETTPCPAPKYTSGQSVTPGNEIVARYGSQHGSPGRFSLPAGESITLSGDAVCENGSWWWTVSNGNWTAWVPEDGPHSLTENDPFRQFNGANQPKKDQKTSVKGTATTNTRSCAQVMTPNLPAGTRVIQILAQCLNLRSSPELKSGNVVGTARNGSRFRLAFDPSPNWFLITVPGLGDVWAFRGTGDSLAKQIQ